MKYAVPYYFGAAGISVNKKKVPGGNYERTWNIFADSQFKGHASMMDDYREVLGDALMYQGNSVCTTNETELKNAVDLIKTSWLPNIIKFDAEGFGKDFARGDKKMIIGICTDSRMASRTYNDAKAEIMRLDIGENQFCYQNLYTVGLIKQGGVLVDNIEDVIKWLQDWEATHE